MNEHEPTCGVNTVCLVYHTDGRQCRGECTCNILRGQKSAMNELIDCQWENCSGGQFCEKHSLEQAPCHLTNSSHEKALVRVAERVRFEKYTVDEGQLREAIQVLCSCGHIISSNEIKN